MALLLGITEKYATHAENIPTFKTRPSKPYAEDAVRSTLLFVLILITRMEIKKIINIRTCRYYALIAIE
jgi:hypothetical protein